MIRTIALPILLLLATLTFAASKVSLVGLFPGAAVLFINGERHFIKEGEAGAGIMLVSTTSETATISIGGQLRTLHLGRETSSDYVDPETPVITITRSRDGHYWVNGKINGQSVRMVLDTGATNISISTKEADRLGLRYKNGKLHRYQTANGTVSGYQITLNSVSIQGLEENNIEASVIPSDHPILLGMSFLKRVNMREKGNLLYLERRY